MFQDPKQARKYSLLTNSANELDRFYGWSQRRCKVCGEAPTLRCKVFYPVKEYAKNYPQIWQGIIVSAFQQHKKVPTVSLFSDAARTHAEDYLKVLDIVVCKHHEADLRAEARKVPSWCCTEMSFGADANNQVVGKPIKRQS